MKKLLLPLLATLVFWLPHSTLAATFPDVTDQTDYAEAIAWTVDEGITQGYENGNWGPDDCVTRAQLLKMVLEHHFRASIGVLASPLEVEEDFWDVPKASHWRDYVSYAQFLEIATGYPDGTFKTDSCVNRVEAMKITLKTLMSEEGENDSGAIFYDGHPVADMYASEWYTSFVKPLFKNKLVGGKHIHSLEPLDSDSATIQFFPAEPMSRKEVAEMLFRINKFQSTGMSKIYKIDYGEGYQDSVNVNVILVEIDKKTGERKILDDDMMGTYGRYFSIFRQPTKNDSRLILKGELSDTDFNAGELYYFYPDTLNLKELAVSKALDQYEFILSPNQNEMIGLPYSVSEKDVPQEMYFVDLLGDSFRLMLELKEGETFFARNDTPTPPSHAVWIDNHTIKYAVYQKIENTSENKFLEYRKVSLYNPLSGSYFSSNRQRELPYFYLEPNQPIEPKGIFIYLHGAGGSYEQGMQEDNYAGNFKNLKAALKENNFVYATPETSGFGTTGGADMLDFLKEMKAKYGDLPIYLSGASAGGSTLFSTLNALKDTSIDIKGVAFVVPAISTAMIDEMDWATSDFPIWIEAGEKDAVFPPDRVVYFENALNKKGYSVVSNVIPNGDHNAPVEKIDWVTTLDYLKYRSIHTFYKGEDYSIIFIQGEGIGYIDPKGEIIVYGYMFDNGPDYFKEGLARYTKDEKIGFMNEDLEIIIPAQFDGAGFFENGSTRVCNGCEKVISGEHWTMEGGVWGTLDINGNVEWDVE